MGQAALLLSVIVLILGLLLALRVRACPQPDLTG